MKKNLLLTALLLAGATPLAGTMHASAEPQQANQTQGTITGTVVDEQGEPVIGASVMPIGRENMGASTDVNGQFSLRVPAGTMLKVTFVGYDPVEMRASNGMLVKLSVTESLLDEIVVVGYGTQKKINLTGAVSTVDVAKTLDSRPVVDVAKALQGAVPGLTISMANGDIGSAPSINIRGVGTLSNSHTSTPLIIVDGVPVDDMSYLNPDDIESISVLKDAASTAIYGARAAFGVILITTKQGETQDRVRVNYTNNFAWSHATVLPDFNNLVTDLTNAMNNTNPGGDQEIFGMYYTDLLPYAQLWQQQHNGKRYTDMVQVQPYQNEANVGDYVILPNGSWLTYGDWDVAKTAFSSGAFSQKHNLSLEGQSGKTNYRLSFSYDDREGLIRVHPDKLKRYTAAANVDTQIFSWLKAGARFNFAQRIYTDPGVSYNFYQYTWRWPGQFMMYGYTVDDETGEKTYFRNELAARIGAYEQEYTWSKTSMQAYFLANLTKDIMLQGDFTYNINSRYSNEGKIPYYMWNTWTPASPFSPFSYYSDTTDWAGNSAFKDARWAANVYATFDKTFAEKHNLKVMLGWAADHQSYNYFYADRDELIDPNYVNVGLATSANSWTISGSAYNRATTGFFGRLNYNYNDIWLLEANLRYDGSSLFPAKDQWAWFPSASAGYRFSQESFFDQLRETWWNNGKIRFSYGQVGNQAIGSNMFISTVSKGGNTAFLNASGNPYVYFNAPTAVSETLTWERLITYDVGLDLGFLHNTLNFGFDWFQRDTKDMLAPGQVLPGVYGVGAPYQNAGSLRTKGWELSVMYNNRFGEVDVWGSFMLSDAQTKITKWNNPSGIIYSYLPQNSNYTEGFTFGDIYGFEVDRYFTVDDFIWDTADGKWQSGASMTGYAPGIADQTGLQSGQFVYGPGDVKFVDQNGDNKINVGKNTVEDPGDIVKIGNAMPRYQYSFRLGAAWKGFDIDLFFQGVGKQSMWATGSTIVPMAQSGYGTFTNQNSYNKVEYNGSQLMSYDINQNYDYPRMWSGVGANVNSILSLASYGYGIYNYYPNSRYLVNLAYLRLKNLTVGYTLPRRITSKALIQKARLYFSADNLCFLYAPARKYQLDPEMTTISGSSVIGNNSSSVGTFGRTVPIQATLSFGVQVSF